MPGKLYIVGIGPGKSDLLTVRAKKVLREAEVVLGHRTYVRRVMNVLNPEAEVIESKMGKELERVKLAVKLSKDRRVCLVSGGDPGIYGMTSLVLEYIMMNGINVSFEVVPGITAMSSASPLLGCPVSGDHCVISLSDLLVPWDVVERRLISALLGDFVVVVYNPSSRRRAKNLKRAMEIILRFKGDVPVGCVKNAEREKTEVWITTPSEVVEELKRGKNRINMHTILFIPSSETVFDGKRMLTPRGYSSKYELRESSLENSLQLLGEVSGAKTDEGLRIAEKSAGVAKMLLSRVKFGKLERFIAERCITATADPSISALLRFNRTEDVIKAMKGCEKVVVDVEMVKAGIESRVCREILVASKLGDGGKTMVSAGIRKLKDCINDSFVAIGNAPSALEELCRIIEEGIKPGAVVATPVGFTNAAGAKGELMKKDVPWIVVEGVRGGSTLCVAIVNAVAALSGLK